MEEAGGGANRLPMGSESYHEPLDLISERTKNLHRAIVSLIEELDAIDWYQQRAEAASDEALKAVLLHNKREEIEHALMVLEWIRRNDADFEQRMRVYLFQTAPITQIEFEREKKGGGGTSAEPEGRAGEAETEGAPAARRASPPSRPLRASEPSGPMLGIGSLRR